VPKAARAHDRQPKDDDLLPPSMDFLSLGISLAGDREHDRTFEPSDPGGKKTLAPSPLQKEAGSKNDAAM
jgi:hypothetical protein